MPTYKAKYTQNYSVKTAVVTAAVSGYDSDTPTNTTQLFQAGADGALVTEVAVMPRATCTASRVDLWVTSNGTVLRLIGSEIVPATTVSNTGKTVRVPFSGISTTTPLVLGPGERLHVGSGVALAGGFVFTAKAEDY